MLRHTKWAAILTVGVAMTLTSCASNDTRLADGEPEDGGTLLGFVSDSSSLSALPPPAFVVHLSDADTVTETKNRITLSAHLDAVLFVDASREDLQPPVVGPIDIWGPRQVVTQAASAAELRESFDGVDLVALIGDHSDEWGGLPGRYEVMALFVDVDGDLVALGSNRNQLDRELETLSEIADLTETRALLALSAELVERDLSLAAGLLPAASPLLSELAPAVAVDWSELSYLNRDVMDASDEFRATLVEFPMTFEFEEGATAPGFVLGVLSEAGWTGATTMDVAFPLALKAFIEPGSEIRVVVYDERKPGDRELIQIAVFDPEQWEGAVGAHFIVSKALLDAIASGESVAMPVEKAKLITDTAELREIRSRLFVPAGGSFEDTTDPITGVDESELSQDPNAP